MEVLLKLKKKKMKSQNQQPTNLNQFDLKCMTLRAKIDAWRELYRAIGVKRKNLEKSQKLRQELDSEIIAMLKDLTKDATIYKILSTVGMKYKNTIYPLKRRLDKENGKK